MPQTIYAVIDPPTTKTSFLGRNLYPHRSDTGIVTNCYWATPQTTLWEATAPFRWCFAGLALTVFLDTTWAIKKPPNFNKYLGSPTRFNNWLLFTVLLLFSIDDVGTSIGFQAHEDPRGGYESNPGFCIFLEYLIINNVVSTHTSGFRMVHIIFLSSVLLLQFFNLLGPLTKLWWTRRL